MSTMYRVLGIEFVPARLDATIPISKGKTGFEIGRSVFYETHMAQPNFESMVTGMGISLDSEACYDMRDMLRIGDSDMLDFTQDFITGWVHSAELKNQANKTMACFQFASDYLKSKNRELIFSGDQLLDALGETDNIPIVISSEKGLSESDLRTVLAMGNRSMVSIVKNGNIFFNDGQYPFDLPAKIVYNDEICRSITKFFGKINSALYEGIAQLMEEESYNEKIRKIREYVSDNSMGGFSDPYRMPNFFDQ